MRGDLHGLPADCRGNSTIELALIVPLLALLILVAADIALAFKAKIILQRAAERAAQLATSGGYESTAYDSLAADAAEAAGVSTGNVGVTSTLLCDDVAQTTPDTPCSPGQQIKRYVAISISGTYSPLFGKLVPATRWGSMQIIAISGFASVRLQ